MAIERMRIGQTAEGPLRGDDLSLISMMTLGSQVPAGLPVEVPAQTSERIVPASLTAPINRRLANSPSED